MVRITGLSEYTLNDIRAYTQDHENCGSFGYAANLYEDVRVEYSFGELTLRDSSGQVTIKSYDYNEVIMD